MIKAERELTETETLPVTLGMLTRRLLQECSSRQSDAPWPERSIDC